jgi:hypothetical protein
LDWEKVASGEQAIAEADKVDIVLGADVIYGLHLAEWLPQVLVKLLKPQGIFVAVNPKNRWVKKKKKQHFVQPTDNKQTNKQPKGVDEFLANLEKLGFECSVRTLPEEFCEDFVKKSCWDLFICTLREDEF